MGGSGIMADVEGPSEWKAFTAPWSRLLIIVSVLAAALCLAIAITRFSGALSFIPIVTMAGCALFTVRGYAITPEDNVVRRLFWNTRLPRIGLVSATFSPSAMKGSIRRFGNGGLFSFTGWFRNRELGNYRAFATDMTRSVVLRYPGKTIVVTPGDVEGFVRELIGS